MTAPLHFVTATHLGKQAGVSRHTAAKHARAAGVREAGGRFDPEPALEAIRRGLDADMAQGHRLVGRGERMDAAPVSGLTLARERQALAAAEAREIANAERRKQLVDREAVVAALADVVVRVRSAMMGIVDKSSPKIAAVSDVASCRAVLESDIRDALTALASCDDIHRAFLA